MADKAEIARCPTCRRAILEDHPYPWCRRCGETLPGDIRAAIPSQQRLAAGAASAMQPARRSAGPLRGPIGDTWVRRIVLVWLCGGISLALLQTLLFDEVLYILTPFTLLGYLGLGACLAGYVAWHAHGPKNAAPCTVNVGCGIVLGLIVGSFLGFSALAWVLGGYAAWIMLRPSSARHSTLRLTSGAVLGLALATVPLMQLGATLTFRTRFRIHRAEYARTVDSLLAAGPTSHDTIGNVLLLRRYLVDLGPPVRVAFLQGAKVADNWQGVVYDPTGAVLAAQGWSYAGGQQEFTAPPEIRSLFLGDLLGCSHIEGPWYRCSFT